jgi:Zn-dependent peptidase ImmA (M78 family)
MFDLPSKSDIEAISMDLLKQSKSIDVFPTPVDSILRHVDLRIETKIDLSKVDKSFFGAFDESAAKDFIDSLNQVRGILDKKDRTIYLDKSQIPSRKNFVKLHETGHEVLYWQEKILACFDNDETLHPSIKEEFEAEANYFASTILFQNDRFENEMSKLKFGIHAPMDLANVFGASKHATMRKYVECSDKRCALLVLENSSEKGQPPICSKKDFFASRNFIHTFGSIDFPEKFGYTWNFARDYYFKKKLHMNGSIPLNTENGTADFHYHFFNNTYNAFVFLFPLGEDKLI